MRIAIEGCAHGELDKIYATLEYIEKTENTKIDLLLICGDFQSLRNAADLDVLACPPKYRVIGGFYQYYSGQKKAPYPTIFVGGNHEASNYLWELFHGGWVCPNIYYLGFAGVIKFGGLRIGGLSGIYKDQEYDKGYYEQQPFNESTCRSIYHIRKYNVYRLLQLAGTDPMDVFLSHDWPRGIAFHGNMKELLASKPFLKDEIDTNSLGSMPGELILKQLMPRYWFAAHLHVKFAALVKHGAPNGDAAAGEAVAPVAGSAEGAAATSDEAKPTVTNTTRFLALDKCVPSRDFLQIIDIPHGDASKGFAYDPEWLAVVRATNDFLSLSAAQIPLPEPADAQANIAAQLAWIKENLLPDGAEEIPVPNNFVITAPPYNPQRMMSTTEKLDAMMPHLNPQTVTFSELLQMENHINPQGRPPWIRPPTPPPPAPTPEPPAPEPVAAVPSAPAVAAADVAELEELLKAGDVDLEHMSAKDFLQRFVQGKKAALAGPAATGAAESAKAEDNAEPAGAADAEKAVEGADAAEEAAV